MIRDSQKKVWSEKYQMWKTETTIENYPGVAYTNTAGDKGRSPYDYCKSKGEKKTKDCNSLGGRHNIKIFKCPFYKKCDLK